MFLISSLELPHIIIIFFFIKEKIVILLLRGCSKGQSGKKWGRDCIPVLNGGDGEYQVWMIRWLGLTFVLFDFGVMNFFFLIKVTKTMWCDAPSHVVIDRNKNVKLNRSWESMNTSSRAFAWFTCPFFLGTVFSCLLFYTIFFWKKESASLCFYKIQKWLIPLKPLKVFCDINIKQLDAYLSGTIIILINYYFRAILVSP